MPVEITPIYLVLAAAIGLLVGLLVASLFPTKEVKHTNLNEPPAELTKEGYAEAARLWYSPAEKKVITELDGGHYRDYSSLSTEQKMRVDRLMDFWSEWTGKQPHAQPLEWASKELNVESAEEEVRITPEPILDWSVSEALKTEEEKELVKTEIGQATTVAGQISLILEKMLEGNPLREKGIKLIENTRHGVDVWVGLEKFDGIDAIPYPEVQHLIRQAAAQWERETEAGRNQR